MCQGIKFVNKGLIMIIGVNSWLSFDSYILSIALGIMIMFTWCPWDKCSSNKNIRILALIAEFFPTALIMFLIGCIISVY